MKNNLHKKQMNEEEIKMNFITPEIEAAGCDKRSQIHDEITFYLYISDLFSNFENNV